MNKVKIVVAAIILSVIAASVWWLGGGNNPVFPDLTGPSHTTVVPAPVATRLSDFPDSGTHSMAIWVKDPDSSWLGLAMGLNSMGIPFRLVSDIDQALAHRVVLIYPSLTGGNTPPEQLDRIRGHVEDGGSVIAFSVIGGGMPTLFGFETSEEHSARRLLSFTDHSLMTGLVDLPVERTLTFDSPGMDSAGLPGTHYVGAKDAIATFEDGSAAITYMGHPAPDGRTGHAYAFGLDLGHFVLRAINGRFSGMSESYVNTYQPKIDTQLRLLARMYQRGEPNAVLISPTPHGKSFTALITHDVDFTRSIINIPEFVALETRFGVPATYFIQTKYVTDYNDRRFFDPSRLPTLQLLADSGMEIASHTVSHSNEFARMPVGTGDERYPDYQPFVRDFDRVENATMQGELRVSQFLLESQVDVDVVSFRPGHLSLPEPLPQLLVANGYRFSSSITANEALTHLPFRMSYNRSYGSLVDAYEFPVTIEDEQGNLLSRFAEISALTDQIAQYQGLVNIMIHTDSLSEKLTFLEQYLTRYRDMAWFDTVSGYGSWWAARESVSTDVVVAPGLRQLQLAVPQAIEGLTLLLPDGWRYRDGLEGTQQSGNQLVLGRLQGTRTLSFEFNELNVTAPLPGNQN